MLYKKFDKASGKVLKTYKTTLFSAADGYIRPKEDGSFWWLTTTSIWNVDELIGRRIRDWRRLTNETGHSGERTKSMRQDHDSLYTGTHSVFPAPLAEWIYLRYAGNPGSCILDSFSGGPPRAIVAALMGYKYVGYEIRQEQIDENLRIIDNLGISSSIEYRNRDGCFLHCSKPSTYDFALTCHPASTRILTASGLIPINKVKIGQEVITHTGSFHKVIETKNLEFSGTILSIKRMYRQQPLLVTPEHPLLVNRDNKIEWIEAKHLIKGDYLLEPLPSKTSNPIDGRIIADYQRQRYGTPPKGTLNIAITAPLLRSVGYYLSQGSVNRSTVSIAINSDKTNIHKEVVDTLTAVLGAPATIKQYGTANVVRIVCSNVIVENLFGGCGKSAHSKRFPKWVWSVSDKLLKELVIGLFKGGDGWVESHKEGSRFGYASVSEQLTCDIQRLLLNFGVVSSLTIKMPKTTEINGVVIKSKSPQYYLSIRGIYADKLSELTNIKISIPSQKRRLSRSPFIKNGYVHYKIESISGVKAESLPVFNLEVENDHSYLADGVVSHNCPPYYNLEQYSDLSNDLSNLPSYEEFDKAMLNCAEAHFRVMKPGAFVCIVTCPFRLGGGKDENELIDFPGDTVRNFKNAGFMLWQKIVLSRNFASAAVRSTTSWKGLKLVPRHEELLVFKKPHIEYPTK